MSLLSAVVMLKPVEDTEVQGNLGRATHAWFLTQVHAHDPALSEALHAENREKPFTVSDLRKVKGGKNEGAAPFFLRVTSYEASLTELLSEDILPNLPETVVLGGKEFRIGKVFSDPSRVEDPAILRWVGRTNFGALLEQNALGESIPPRVTLRFDSPSVFRSKGNFMLVPLPRLVFEGLARKWNAYAPVTLPQEVSRYAEEGMTISSYRLRTRVVRFGEEQSIPGFVGTCTYAMRVKDRYWMGMIHALAAFAFYAGIGKQTTMGMGQARRVTG